MVWWRDFHLRRAFDPSDVERLGSIPETLLQDVTERLGLFMSGEQLTQVIGKIRSKGSTLSHHHIT